MAKFFSGMKYITFFIMSEYAEKHCGQWYGEDAKMKWDDSTLRK